MQSRTSRISAVVCMCVCVCVRNVVHWQTLVKLKKITYATGTCNVT